MGRPEYHCERTRPHRPELAGRVGLHDFRLPNMVAFDRNRVRLMAIDRFDFIELIDRRSRALRRPSPWSSFACVPHRSDVVESIRRLESELRKFGVVELHLFGSVAKGEASWDSDVDVAAVMDWNHPGLSSVKVTSTLESELMRSVDVACLPFDPPLAGSVEADLERVF